MRKYLQAIGLAMGLASAAAAGAPERTIELTVTKNGFEPTPVTVKKGQPLKLVITRKVEKTCATDIVVKDYNIQVALPLDKAVSVSFTPTKAGPLKYGCAMGQMVGGVLLVE